MNYTYFRPKWSKKTIPFGTAHSRLSLMQSKGTRGVPVQFSSNLSIQLIFNHTPINIKKTFTKALDKLDKI